MCVFICTYTNNILSMYVQSSSVYMYIHILLMYVGLLGSLICMYLYII